MKQSVTTAVVSLVSGIVLAELWRRWKKSREKGDSDIEKRTAMDVIGNTPLIYLKSLSEETKCHIFVLWLVEAK